MERLHAPNEFFRIRRLREGMRAREELWRQLADDPHRLEPADKLEKGPDIIGAALDAATSASERTHGP